MKSDHEIDLIAQSAAIADAAMAEIAAVARQGLTTRKAAAVAAAVFLRRGADSGETGPIVRGRGHHEFLHELFRTEALDKDDILHVELIPRVMNYSARMMRPIVIGQPSTGQQRVAAELIRTPRSSDFSRVFLPDANWLLEENMVFHVYTTAQGLGFSETVVVTPEGGRRLTATPRRILNI